MGARRKGREFALQILYLTDVANVTPEKAFTSVTTGENIEQKAVDFAKDLSFGTLNNKKAIDQIIKKYAENWEMNRMAALDRNILRMGAYELIYQPETPVSVIIDEAVEIAKLYSTVDSGKFVNGILDKIKKERKDDESPRHGKDTPDQEDGK